MNFLSATEIAQQIRNGSLTSTAITQHYLQRIEQHNSSLNAYVYIDSAGALNKAAECDRMYAEAIAKGASTDTFGPLFGVPLCIKESFLWAGTATTLNYPPMKNFKATHTSYLVQRLLNAGAIILGKTNVPTLLADIQTAGPLYPTCNNPYDLTRTPGGSTGGGAAALAADLTSLELGSDIGGSIRNPSNFCGLFGLKPTENGHVNDGHLPPLPAEISGNTIGLSVLNNTGPLARSAHDLELAYNVLYQPNWNQLQYLPVARPQNVSTHLKDYRFAYFDSVYGIHAGAEACAGLQKTIQLLEAQGATVEKTAIPEALAKRLFKVWACLFGFMMGQNLSWPIRKLFYLQFRKTLKQSSLPASKELKLGLSLNFAAFTAALAERQAIIAELNETFSPFDAVLSPTSMGPAFEHNPKHNPIALDGSTMPYLDYCLPFVALYNLSGHPVLTVPSGLSERGLPVGISISAPHHCEASLLQIGKLLESHGLAFSPPMQFQ